MWHVTRDTLALTVCDLWYYEDLEEKDDLNNEWMNDEAVYRRAPATPGLLIITRLTSSVTWYIHW